MVGVKGKEFSEMSFVFSFGWKLNAERMNLGYSETSSPFGFREKFHVFFVILFSLSGSLSAEFGDV